MPLSDTEKNEYPVLEWVLTEAPYPVAFSYHRLIHEISDATHLIALIKIQDYTSLLVRYASVIQMANRYARVGENGNTEQQLLTNLHDPDGQKFWLNLLIRLTKEAEQKGWEEVRPVHQWLFEENDRQERGLDLLDSLYSSQSHSFLALIQQVLSYNNSTKKTDVILQEQFSFLNRLIDHASFLKTWPLLYRLKGVTQAWTGFEGPKNSSIRTPKKFEGRFILYWDKRKFLPISPHISLLAERQTDDRIRDLLWKEGLSRVSTWIQTSGSRTRQWIEWARSSLDHLNLDSNILNETSWEWPGDTNTLLEGLKPLGNLLLSPGPVKQEDLSSAFDTLHKALQNQQFTHSISELADSLRQSNVLPNEQSTEDLIRFLVDQFIKRSPVSIPDKLVDQFWKFFADLQTDPQTKGLMEINYDILRYLLRIYEPLLVELIGMVKNTWHLHREQQQEFSEIIERISRDFQIFRRQVLALRHIKQFLNTDPKDFTLQAKIITEMIHEFGPFFIKFAQVAATHADFLPQQIAKELEQFQEEVPPMPADQVIRAIHENFGQSPEERYYDFDPSQPFQSGSIACVYLAKRLIPRKGKKSLMPVIVKVAREDVEREFVIGETVLELAILSSHYWAPHGKLSPFLEAWMVQVRQWAHGFGRELDFMKEASVQQAFGRISAKSNRWAVPEIYASTTRVLEMEYIQNAKSIGKYIDDQKGLHSNRALRNRIAENLCYMVLLQAYQYKQIHGDLHPGNILVDQSGVIYLIDWGNCIQIKDKFSHILNYIQGVLLADTEKITDALIAISSDPAGNRKRRIEIRDSLQQVLARKGVHPLLKTSLSSLWRRSREDLQRRIEAIPHLLSNTYPMGIVIESNYLQISRSISALAGTYLSLFPGDQKKEGFLLLTRAFAKFPYVLAREKIPVQNIKIRNLLRRD